MKKNYTLVNIIMFVVALLPLGYLAIVWNALPPQVPVHFDAQMKPDRISNKSELWIMSSILAGASMLVYFLLQKIYLIDPKRKNKTGIETFNKLGAGLVIFFAALNILIIISAQKAGVNLERLLFPLIGLLFVFLGNYMPALKPNYFAGIRLPWTLSDDENWRKTHQLGGKIWFWGGLVFSILSLFLPKEIILPIFITTVLIMILIPGIYSYTLFRSKLKKEGSTQ
ncbi:MAG: SdpI family protein [Bacteroidota bacterium]|nr:SdpI family protein [Bacteroidota bacterium]